MKKIMTMKIKSNRIKKLSESPCSKCGLEKQCFEKIKRNYQFAVIKDNVFGNKDFDFHECGLWIALKAMNDGVAVDNG